MGGEAPLDVWGEHVSKILAYLDGVEIDKIPELAEVCAQDDWLNAFMRWLSVNRPGMRFEAVVSVESVHLDDGKVLEIWVPKAPYGRAAEIGGVLKAFSKKDE